MTAQLVLPRDAAELRRVWAADFEISAAPEPVDCSICLEGDANVLLPCGHRYHADCLDRWFETRQVCPTCGRHYGDTVGTMPDGVMSWHWQKQRLAGHSCPTVVLHFFFPRGTADGQEFDGRSQHAYLPDDEKGRELLALFQLAFRRRVLFSLRPSLTNGRLQPTFAIHMKTSMSGGPARHGYPDPGYFAAAVEELRLAGVDIDAALPVAVSLQGGDKGCSRCRRLAVGLMSRLSFPVIPLACFFALAGTGEGRMAVLAAISAIAALTLPVFPSTVGFMLWILLTTIGYTTMDMFCMLVTVVANVYVLLRYLLQRRYSCFDTVAIRARPWVANRLFVLGVLILLLLYSGIWKYHYGLIALGASALTFLIQLLLRPGRRSSTWVQDTPSPDLRIALERAPWPRVQVPVGDMGPIREEDWARYSCCTSLQGRTDMRRVHEAVLRPLEDKGSVSAVIQQLLANELRFGEEHVVFYHSYSTACLLYELQAVLAAELRGYPPDGPPVLRLARTPFESISSLQELLDHRGSGQSDRTPEFRSVAISAFCSCFASGGYGRSMLESFFLDGYYTSHNVGEDIGRLLALILDPAGDMEKLPELLSQILQLGSDFGLDSRLQPGARGPTRRRGHVMQIFVHESVVDAVAYGAQPLGSLAPQGVPVSEWIRQQCPVEGQARLFLHPDLFLDTRRGLVKTMAASPRPFDRAGLRARLLAMLQPHMAKVAQDELRAAFGYHEEAAETPAAAYVPPEESV